MRRGAISLGDIQCDKCRNLVGHGERYLAIEEDGGAEADRGQTVHYCVPCAVKKGYASYRADKEGKILTVFPPGAG
jgi:ribosomal protein S26